MFQGYRNEKPNQIFIPDKLKMGKPSKKKPTRSLEEEWDEAFYTEILYYIQ